jgi:hypothetical protein
MSRIVNKLVIIFVSLCALWFVLLVFPAVFWQLLVAENNPILWIFAIGFGLMILGGILEAVWGWLSNFRMRKNKSE